MRPTLAQYAETPRDAAWLGMAAAGLSLCFVLTGTFDTVLANVAPVTTFGYRIDGAVPGNAPVVLACLCLAVLAWRLRALRQPGAATAAILAALQAGAVGVLFATAAQGISPLAVGAWWVLCGASTVQTVAWVQLLSQVGRERSLLVFAGALFIDALVGTLAYGWGGLPLLALLLAACVLSAGLLWRCARAAYGTPPLFGGAAERNDGAPLETLPLPLALACLACYGAIIGYIQSAGSTSMGATGSAQSAVTPLVALAVLACCLAAFSAAFARLPNPDALLRACVLAVLVASVYLLGVLGKNGTVLGLAASTVTRTAAFAYAWLLACEALPHPTRATFVFSSGWGLFTLAQTVSTKAGLSVIPHGGAAVAAYGTAVAASLTAIVVLNLWPQLSRRGKRPPAALETADPGADLYERGCALLVAQSSLTPREAQVLLPLVRGRANSSIAASLDVGVETVRTHIRHIYQKTGMHSREELMDTVERLGR